MPEIKSSSEDSKSLYSQIQKARLTAQENIKRTTFPADLYRFTGDEDSAGLTEIEAYALFSVATELASNVARGLGITHDIEERLQADKVIDEAFKQAKAQKHPQPYALIGLKFDQNSGDGSVYASHPIVPGFSPNLPKIDAPRTGYSRKTEPGQNPTGGIENIESGEIHKRLLNAGLEHSNVTIIDENLGGGFSKRILRVNFQRKRN
jgi:hypothetical protein